MTTPKINMVTTQDYHSQTPIVFCMILKPNTFVKGKGKIFGFSNYSAKSKNIMMI